MSPAPEESGTPAPSATGPQGRRAVEVLFVNPLSNAPRKPVLPMSLLALGAMIEDEVPYSIVDGNLESDLTASVLARLEAIAARGARAVLAVTVMPGPQLQQAVPLCRAIRAELADTVILWGGYFPSQHWDVAVADDAVDFVLRGHAEYSFAPLLDWIARAEDPRRPEASELKAIPGLAWFDDQESRSNPQPKLPHPADLPQWNLDRVPVERYLRRTFLGQRTLGYSSSYGCPFFCNFCAVVNLVQGGWLAQPAERVADAVRNYHERWDVDAVEFVDNNFFVQEKRVAEFSERILDLGVAWWGEGRIDTMLGFKESTWKAMRDSGLRMVFLGAESGSAETLERMDKGGRMSPEKTLEMVETMRRWDIVPELSFVLGNPPDPEADARGTLEFIRKVKRLNPAAEIILYQYTPVPLSGDLFHQAKAAGFSFPESLEEWASGEWFEFAQRRSETQMPWLRGSLRRRLHDFERVLNAYYPTSTLRSLTPTRRRLLRAASAWRYRSRFYAFPYELAALQRLMRYQRPETAGF